MFDNSMMIQAELDNRVDRIRRGVPVRPRRRRKPLVRRLSGSRPADSLD